MNKVILMGRVVKDAEVKQLSNGNNLIKFCVVTSKKWKDKSGEWQEKAQFHNVSGFGKYENLAPHVTKGKVVVVEGAVEYDKVDKDDGSTVTYTTIMMSRLDFGLTNKDSSDQPFKPQSQSQPQAQTQSQPKQKIADNAFDDDIPF